MITHVLAIAIPIVGFFAFLSGFYFGKSAGINKIEKENSSLWNELKESINNSYSLGYNNGKMNAVKEIIEFTENLKKKFEAGGNL